MTLNSLPSGEGNERRQVSAQAAKLADLFAQIPANLSEELVQTILETPTLRIQRIVSRGHASLDGFWYDENTPEWVLVLQGAARLTIEGEGSIELQSGSYVNIPAHKRHRVEWTDPDRPTIWLAVHYS